MQYHLQHTRKYSVLVTVNRSIIHLNVCIFVSVTSGSGTGEHSSSAVIPCSIGITYFCTCPHSHLLAALNFMCLSRLESLPGLLVDECDNGHLGVLPLWPNCCCQLFRLWQRKRPILCQL